MKHESRSVQKQAQPAAQRKRTPSFLCFPGMHNILNFVRLCLYLAVVAWAAIVLGLACNFDKMLVASDLTRFVPLAIFIAATTMLVMIALLLAPIALRHNPITTLYELSSIAFLSVFWLALGCYTATAEMGDVECYADEDETEPIEFAAFTTDIYHAQFRALEGFALINVFLLLGFLFFMLLQAYIQQRKGFRTVWSTPLALYPWFGGRRRNNRSNSTKLPPPVTAKGKSAPAMSSKPTAVPATKPMPAQPVLTAPKPAATKPAVYRSASARTQTQPASRPKPTTAKSTPAVTSATTKPKNYPGQYTRPAAGIPQTKAAPGQSNYMYHVPPAQPAAKSGQRSGAAPAPPPKRR
ncbi:hypothetical protein BKA62DRAFT_690618 [Auriculariales sp. MPI-PUGE-AT-0066]|nr:hypothetical protein BKA62DRAFT_690618 [Auriculariales sp. MPI-PUGE-AT-0066]